MKKIIFFLYCVFLFINVQAQNKYSEQIKTITESYDQAKLADLYNEFSERQTRLKKEAEAYALLNNIPLKKYNEDGSFDELQRLSENGTPIYYTLNNVNAAISTRANYLNSGGGLGLSLDGDNLTAHVWDGGPTRPTHQEFDGAGGNNRVTINDGQTTLNGNSFHSQHVTGTIVASGFQAAAKGMAWKANALTHEWTNDVSEATAEASSGMLVSNHSYGYIASSLPDDQFGQYWLDARDWDDLMHAAPYYLMLVAAGNDGSDDSSNASPLDGESAYDKLSGHATAKNNLVVANGQDANINGDGSLNSVIINPGSSEGPTDDYRIKPDITGNGTALYSSYDSSDDDYASISGTSMATPNVTGTLLLLQEHYSDLNGSFMKAATLKGLALHTADDAGANGPDAVYGWGLLNAKKAAETITTDAAASGNAIIDELSLSQGQTYQITVQSNGVDPLMGSISWTDPVGTINGGTNSNTPALVNDLDIRLDNGTNFTPWRLTGVTTNGTGDNIVDPYERIDVNGASGTYTLTVTHKGSLSGGSQNFSLIVTGIVVATTPVISYSTTSINNLENTDCDYTELNIPLNIAQNPAANATVNFTINGSSTATSGLDFDIMTPSVVFPSGISDPVNLELRVYHDSFIEGDETVIIDFNVVNDSGGDASADINADTFTLTINDDDNSRIATYSTDLINEDFETTPSGWLIADRDGDTNNWVFGAVGATHLTTNQMYSRSWISTTGALTPDNYIFTSEITIPNDLTSLNLSYQVSPSTLTNSWYEEYYTVYWATDISTYAIIDASPQVKPGAIILQAIVNENIDMSAYIGQTGHLVFRHHNCTDEEYIAIDNLLLQGVSETNIQTAVNMGTTNDDLSLPADGTVYASDSVSGDVMLDITNNNSSDDYGCLEVSVSRAGTGAQPYNGSIAPYLVMDKTFEILTENTTGGTGSTSVTFYFTESEITGWENGISPTQDRNNLVIGREIGGVITEVSTATIGAFGTNVSLTGSFSDARGTYMFGAANPVVNMNPCNNDPNVWKLSGDWSKGAPPTTDDMAIILLNPYNTSSGDLDVCSLVAFNDVTINAGEYIKVDGDITINGSGSLTIENQGSLVQVDDNALVTNNGTIEVKKTTIALPHNMFSILGSPMSQEKRDMVFTNSTVVMDHTTSNFIPHSQVELDDPDADNFADDNGDNWSFFSGSEDIDPGVGYLVGPPSGGGAIDVTHNQGTLNNGIIPFTAVYNGTQNGSPNILSNPYASAIDAYEFVDQNAIVDAIFYWEHITSPTSSYPGYRPENWDMGDISMYNLSGGVKAPNESGASAKPSNQYVASGQGFGIKANAGGTVNFNNSMRLTGNNDTYRNNEFTDRLYIEVENPTYSLQSGALIAFTAEATNGMDSEYDAKRLATPVSIYSIVEDSELALQGRSEFNENQIIPIGFRTMVEEPQIYTISINSVEGENLSEATVYLKDNLLNISTNLSEENYTFTANESNQKDRFVIVFTEEVLGNQDINEASISVYPNPVNDQLNITSPITAITEVTIYDVRGRIIKTRTVNNQTSYQLNTQTLESSMYFLKITTQSGSITKRIIKQ